MIEKRNRTKAKQSTKTSPNKINVHGIQDSPNRKKVEKKKEIYTAGLFGAMPRMEKQGAERCT